MTNMNKRTNDNFYPKLICRDGEFCWLCQKTPQELGVDKLEIHETAYELPYKIKNMRLLCHGCNHNPLLRKSRVIEQQELNREQRIYVQKRPIFLRWISNEMMENKHVSLREAIDSAAYICGVSVETTKRWIRPLLSKEGPYTVTENQLGEPTIYLKGKEPYYELFEKPRNVDDEDHK